MHFSDNILHLPEHPVLGTKVEERDLHCQVKAPALCVNLSLSLQLARNAALRLSLPGSANAIWPIVTSPSQGLLEPEKNYGVNLLTFWKN